MFRAFCFLANATPAGTSIRLTTDAVPTRTLAEAILDKLLTQPSVTGGDIETEIPGIGWVVATEDEVESIQIMSRRREHPVEASDVW